MRYKIYNKDKVPVRALNGVNLGIEKGEFTAIVGPSGSGKTTLLNIIGGLDSASDGNVSVLGQSLENTSHNERAKVRRKNMGFILTLKIPA